MLYCIRPGEAPAYRKRKKQEEQAALDSVKENGW